jgi:alkylated DNA repair dioxygenase AlkB
MMITSAYISSSAEAALLEKIDQQPWRTDLKRRVQHYGYVYDYRARRVAAESYLGPLPPWLAKLAQRLKYDAIFCELPQQVIINEYLPGQGISPHIDCEPCFGPVIASLSLGASVVMRLDGPEGEREDLLLDGRSLLVLEGEKRNTWRHSIPARKTDMIEGLRRPRNRRVSLTFRTIRS